MYHKKVIQSASTFITSPEGAPIATDVLFKIYGTVNANAVTIQNCLGQSGKHIFKVYGGASLNMTGAKVVHVSSPGSNVVASVDSNGTWIINSGTEITGNYVGGNGGICVVYGTVIMNGDSINNTTAINSNGTVFMVLGDKCYFEMNGGEITNNTGVIGTSNGRCAAVYLHANGKMRMTIGTIQSNAGAGRGGIDSYKTNCQLTITGGSVIDNISINGNSNHDIYTPGFNVIMGGYFTQDVSEWCAEEFICRYDKTIGEYVVFEHNPASCEASTVEYFFDEEDHWVICSVCGETRVPKLPHDPVSEYHHDAEGHWLVTTCTDPNCGWVAEGEHLNHYYMRGECTTCGEAEEGYVDIIFALAARYAVRYKVQVVGENVSVDGDLTIKYKRNGTVQITPDEGFRIVDVVANGQPLGAVDSVTFKKVTADPILFILTEPVPAEDAGTVTP